MGHDFQNFMKIAYKHESALEQRTPPPHLF